MKFTLLLSFIGIGLVSHSQNSSDFYAEYRGPASGISVDYQGNWFRIDPSIEIRRIADPNGDYSTLFGSDNFTVTLKEIHFFSLASIIHKGKEYYRSDFDNQLDTYFDQIKVNSLSMTVYVSGLADCKTFSYAAWIKQSKVTLFCKQEASLSIDDVTISSISVSGLDNLKKKIDELEQENGKKEKIQKLLDEASILQNQDKLEEALEKYNQVLQLDPSNNEALLNKEILEKKIAESKKNKDEKEKKEEEENKKKREKDEERIKVNRKYYQDAASAISRGEAYLRSGNYSMALMEFEAAQTAYQAAGYYSQELASKIADVKMNQSVTQIAQGLQELSVLMSNTLERMDPTGIFSWSYLGLSYETSIPRGDNTLFSQPAVDMQFSFLTFAAGIKFAYYKTNLQQFAVDMRNSFTGDEIIDEKVTISDKGLNLELSAGLSVPVKNFNFRLLYGISVLRGENFEVVADDFRLSGSLPYDFKLKPIHRGTLCINYQFPKSHFGVGLNFSYLWQNWHHWGFSDEDKVELNYLGSNPDYQYSHAFYIANPNVPEKFNRNAFTFGASLLYIFDKRPQHK